MARLTETPKHGDRVRLMLRTIVDVPYGRLGTVVGNTRADGAGSVIVSFDDVPQVRYLARSEIRRLSERARGDGK